MNRLQRHACGHRTRRAAAAFFLLYRAALKPVDAPPACRERILAWSQGFTDLLCAN